MEVSYFSYDIAWFSAKDNYILSHAISHDKQLLYPLGTVKIIVTKKMFYATEPKQHNLEAVGQRHKSGFSGQEKKT